MVFYKSEALSAVCTPATVCPSYEVPLFCATEKSFMRNSCFERDYTNINIEMLRRWFISAELAKAATEESIFRGKKGALFTLALFGAKVKAIAA